MQLFRLYIAHLKGGETLRPSDRVGWRHAMTKTVSSTTSGYAKRKACAPFVKAFMSLDDDGRRRFMDNLSAFGTAVEPLVMKFAAKAQPMFSAAVTTKLSDGSTITVLTPTRAATFVEWFTAATGMPADTPIDTLAKLLKEHGHLINPTQVEEMKKRTDRGEPTGMRTDGWGNWFPRQDGDSVSVGYAFRVTWGGTTTSTTSLTAVAGALPIAFSFATWILRNWGSRSLYSDFPNVPLSHLRGRGMLFLLHKNTLAPSACAYGGEVPG